MEIVRIEECTIHYIYTHKPFDFGFYTRMGFENWKYDPNEVGSHSSSLDSEEAQAMEALFQKFMKEHDTRLDPSASSPDTPTHSPDSTENNRK